MLIAIVFVGSVFMYKNPRALAQAGLLPFGGPILDVRWCECPVPGYLITVGPPVGGMFIYSIASTIPFPNYGILIPKTWTLGLYTPGLVGCGHIEDYCADQIISKGVMYMVGTS